MELRSPSSTTRETRPRPSPSALSSSDAGEKEEAMSTRPDYWSSVEDICLPIPGVKARAGNASPEPSRPIPRPSPPPYSFSRPSPFLSPASAPVSPRPLSASALRSPPQRSPSAAQEDAVVSHPSQSASLGDSHDKDKLVSARPSSSVRSSPSPSPASASSPIEQEPETGRSLRNRTAAQLNPYSIEQAKYTRTLLRNGWQGAVVASPRRGEETPEELRRRKVAAAQAPKDDLGGWLEYEEGQPVARGRLSSPTAAEISDDSVDGETLLEREARRRDRMARQVDGALQVGKRTRVRSHTDSEGESAIDQARSPPAVRRIPSKAKRPRPQQSSERASSVGASSSRRPAGKGIRQPRRADSEPPTSSPASQPDKSSRGRKTAAPSKSIHARQQADRSALDARLLAVAGSPASPVRIDLTRSDTEGSSSVASEEEEEEEDEEVIAERKRARMDLAGKRKRALGMMMPAVFMKKAQADLRLMEREKRTGVASGSDAGSGDEDRASDDSEGRNRHRAKVRSVPRLLDQPLVFDGEAFTDESGDDGRQLDPSSSEAESDAVSSWIHSFAPRRQKAPDGDLVDRYLGRPKGKTKRKRQTTGARDASRGKSDPRKRSSDRPDRPRLHETQNTLHHSGRSKNPEEKQRVSKVRASAAINVIPLDTDSALFQHAGRIATIDESRKRWPLPPTNHALVRSDEHEHWASFGKFSHDWDIQRIPIGAQFLPQSFVKRGHLFSLLIPAPVPAPARSAAPFGIVLLSSSSSEEIESLLPLMCDAIFDQLSQSVDAQEGAAQEGDAESDASGEAMRFLGTYISEQLTAISQDARKRFAAAVRSQLQRLSDRLRTTDQERPLSKSMAAVRIDLAWYAFDLHVRLAALDPASDLNHIGRAAGSLIHLLIAFGVERTTKSLKALSDGQFGSLTIDDCSVGAWLGLISLGTADLGKTLGFDVGELCRLIEEETAKALPSATRSGPLTGEILAYTTMMLCAISQISPSGVSTSFPRLTAHWPTITRALDTIRPETLSKSDHTLSNTAVARRDRYLRTVFSRCLVFVERWGWRLDGREDLLPKLFDLVNARRLQDLTIESNSDFPPFLQDLDQFDTSPFDRKVDTAFTTFLKLLIHAAKNLPAKSEADRRRQLTRLFLRLAPINSSPWTRRSPELAGAGSSLINHYSLYLTFAMLSPTSASQRLDQARRLLAFAEVDQSARTVCIRAILYFALLYRHHRLPLSPVVDWLASVASQLRSEHAELEKQQRRDERGSADNPTKSKTSLARQHDSVSLLLMMVLRTVQMGLEWSRDDGASSYPDAALLQPAWTSQLLDSSVALDPIVGSEVVKTISVFLEQRSKVLPRQRVEDTAGMSQDDFGMFDLDFADPALDAMLGVCENASAATGDDPRTQDQKFAQLVKDQLSPAFFRLVSNILVADYGGRSSLTVADRNVYAQQVVECWTRLLTVMIDNDVAEWTPYLRYGDHSWKRISDPLGRRDIGLLLAVQILAHDSDVFHLFRDEFLEIWFQSIVSRKLTAQHALTSALLGVEQVSPLLITLPFDRSEISGKFEVQKDELELRRVEALRATFEQAAELLKPTGLLQAQQSVPRGTILNLLRGMLAALRDNLAAIADEHGRRAYASFCREVLAALRGCGAAELNDQNLPDMRTLANATSM